MNSTIEFLKGKKTYFAVAIGLLYLAGVYLGFWEFDEKILAAFGLGGLAFLRLAVKKAEIPPLLLILAAALAFSGPGCATSNPEGRSLASAAIVVDHAMEGWAAYVAAGQTTPGDETRVKAAYEKYQLAMRGAQGAYLAYEATKDKGGWAQAAAALNAAKGELVALIGSFTNKQP